DGGGDGRHLASFRHNSRQSSGELPRCREKVSRSGSKQRRGSASPRDSTARPAPHMAALTSAAEGLESAETAASKDNSVSTSPGDSWSNSMNFSAAVDRCL